MLHDTGLHLNSELNWIRYKRMARYIANTVPKNSTILDVGCGTGHIVSLISTLRKDLSIYAFDIVRHNCWKKLKRFNIKFSIGNAEHMTFDNRMFDAVISVGVLEHLKKSERFLQETRRILKDDGWLLIFNLPNKYSLNEFMAHYIFSKSNQRFLHECKYDAKEISKMLVKNGFKIIEIGHEFFIPSLTNLISNNLNSFFNKHCNFFDKLDILITSTPLRHFAQSIFIKSKSC
jgi:ubiquinone/menaquinone biosynthesis C-methylase UbiE